MPPNSTCGFGVGVTVNNHFRGCLLATCALLSACGGGGGVNSTPAPSPTPAPTPAPTPSPSPTPTPAPSAAALDRPAPPVSLPAVTSGTLAEALGQAQDFRAGSVEVDLNFYEDTLRTRNSSYGSSNAARLFADPGAGGTYALYNILASGQTDAPNLAGADIGWSDSAADGTRVLRFRRPDYADPLRPDLTLSYVSYGGWEFISRDTGLSGPQRRVNAYFYFGVPTAAGDLPLGAAALTRDLQRASCMIG